MGFLIGLLGFQFHRHFSLSSSMSLSLSWILSSSSILSSSFSSGLCLYLLGITQTYILCKVFLINFSKLFVFSLNSFNSLMKFMVVLLNSVSWGSFRQFPMANLSTGLVGLGREVTGSIFYTVCILAMRYGHANIFLVLCMIWTENGAERRMCGMAQPWQTQ